MIFVYKKWEAFCSKLSEMGVHSITASEVLKGNVEKKYVILKHDVETDVPKAYKMAIIEKKYGHIGTYYVQAYLLEKADNVKLLAQMKNMGHEISYHYDVMDSNKGDLGKAIVEFEQNKAVFEKNGFIIQTVCQHGNPVVDRVGYTSNRDFFRSESVQNLYPQISDIMVDFPKKANTSYLYFSDAGRKFKKIYDPFTNDIINSDEKNVVYADLSELIKVITMDDNYIISTHPHRWTDSALLYMFKSAAFKIIRFIAKLLMKVPLLKKIMSRYYYLAKKI